MQERHKLGREKSPVTFSCSDSAVVTGNARDWVLFKLCFPSQISGPCSSPALPSRGSFWSAPDPGEHSLGQSEKQLQLKPGSKLLPQESQQKAENLRERPGTGKWTQHTRIPQLHKELINQPSCLSHSSPSPFLEALWAGRNRGAVNQEHGVSGTWEGSTYGRNAKKIICVGCN